MSAAPATSGSDLVTALLLAILGLAVAFFAIRPELWERLWCGQVDARPLALTRIAFGLVVLWNFVGLARHLRVFLSDEGMWLPEMARAYFGGPLRHLWDTEHGFEHWWSPLLLPYGKLTVLHYGSPPWFVLALYALLLVSVSLMILGAWTRWVSILSWVLALQLYRYQPMYLSGGDAVIQNFLFLGMLSSWGEAYSIDSRRRCRAARDAAAAPTSAPRVAAWPMRLMMLQLAVIYCASGLLKRGGVWADGEALYYALNLDHFYRVPAQALVTQLQALGILPALTHVVRWWEILFPLALLGAVLRGYEAARAAGTWLATTAGRRKLSWAVAAVAWLLLAATGGLVSAERGALRPRIVAALIVAAPVVALVGYRAVRRRWPRLHWGLLDWGLGTRTWLVFGAVLHLGIDLGINVGTFANVMVSAYFTWLTGPEVKWLTAVLRRRFSETSIVLDPPRGQ